MEAYPIIAQKTDRPFYGIQARGWITDLAPLSGIQAMAAYYVHIIQTVQPEGPYELGGFSLGGLLAYEITRQLQELGETIRTIVMLDSGTDPEPTNHESEFDENLEMFCDVNVMLALDILSDPENVLASLIHRNEPDFDAEEETFFNRIYTRAKERGWTRTKEQLEVRLRRHVKAQKSYKMGKYVLQPLPESDAPTCYFFRNKSGVMLGDLAPYFSRDDDGDAVDAKYWEGFERNITNFHIMDVDSPNHMTLLSDPRSAEKIVAFCEELYSEKGIPGDFPLHE